MVHSRNSLVVALIVGVFNRVGKRSARAVDYYDKGGNPNPVLDAELGPLKLTSAEKDALISFPHSLNGSR